MGILAININVGRQKLRSLVLMAIFLCISSCASRTEITNLYENEEYLGRDYEKILVVDLSGTANEREKFESLLAAAIRAKGNDAIASHTIIGLKVPLNGQSITNAVNASSADAILVTHMSNVKVDPSLKEGRVDVDKQCRRGEIYDPFLYDYAEIKMPDEVEISHTATVVATLYNAADSVRIWGVQSTCFDRETWPEIVVDQTDSIAEQLQRNWLHDQ